MGNRHFLALLCCFCFAANVMAAEPSTDEWRARVVKAIGDIRSEQNRLAAIQWVAQIDRPIFAGPQAAELKRLVEASAPRSDRPQTRPTVNEVFDVLRKSATQPVGKRKVDSALERFRNEPHTASIYNLTSAVCNSGPLDEQLVESTFREVERFVATSAKSEAWGALALAYAQLASRADDEKADRLHARYLDRMVAILVDHPVYQDRERGNTEAPESGHVAVQLFETNRRGDIERLATAAPEDHARAMWIAVVGCLGRQGDGPDAREVIRSRLSAPRDEKFAAKLTAALEGKWRPWAAEFSDATNSSAVGALAMAESEIASGYARRGDAKAALRVSGLEDGEMGTSAADSCCSLAEAALAGGKADAARQLVADAVKHYKSAIDKDELAKDDMLAGRIANAAVAAGLADTEVRRVVSMSQRRSTLVEPLVALVRRHRERNEPGDITWALDEATRRAEATEAGDGGPAKGLMLVAKEHQAAGRAGEAEKITIRAVLGSEQMKDPFFFGPGAYGEVIAACLAMGRADLIDRGYAAITRAEDRAIYAMIASAEIGK